MWFLNSVLLFCLVFFPLVSVSEAEHIFSFTEKDPSHLFISNPPDRFEKESVFQEFLLEEQTHNFYQNQILEYFEDTVFNNSFCHCQANDGCTRGCQPQNQIEQDQSPPVRQCRGKKSMSRSRDRCARHVNSSIMSVIHKFLSGHCQNSSFSQSVEDYQQCIEGFSTDFENKNIHICRNGFIFPSALCMLNLDGQSFDLYQSIPNKRIRNRCKNWDQYNRLLSSVSFFTSPHSAQFVPLFTKISVEQYELFQKDPEKIPKGAIIILKSRSSHGHVEVKTSKKECGKSQNQTCFCSDYCRERERYDPPFKILAVFQWDPELLYYMALFMEENLTLKDPVGYFR